MTNENINQIYMLQNMTYIPENQRTGPIESWKSIGDGVLESLVSSVEMNMGLPKCIRDYVVGETIDIPFTNQGDHITVYEFSKNGSSVKVTRVKSKISDTPITAKDIDLEPQYRTKHVALNVSGNEENVSHFVNTLLEIKKEKGLLTMYNNSVQ